MWKKRLSRMCLLAIVVVGLGAGVACDMDGDGDEDLDDFSLWVAQDAKDHQCDNNACKPEVPNP